MKNRAKCKLCNSIIESFHKNDYVTCACGEISVDGGQDYFKVRANDYNNFLRVDDEGNEIVVTVKEKKEDEASLVQKKPSKKELLEMIDEMIKSFERLPQHALLTPINHSDFISLLMLLASIFRAED